LILKTEVTSSSKSFAEFQQTTWSYLPQDRTLHNHHGENLRSYIHDIISQKKEIFHATSTRNSKLISVSFSAMVQSSRESVEINSNLINK
jgi:hypothetical protein